MKVNLNELTNLVKRGRQAILDMNLVAEIQTIDPTIIGDASSMILHKVIQVMKTLPITRTLGVGVLPVVPSILALIARSIGQPKVR